MRFHRETERILVFQLYAIPHIEIAPASDDGKLDLLTVNSKFIPVHKQIQRVALSGKLRRIHSITNRRHKWLPIFTRQQIGKLPLQMRDSPQRLRIAVGDLIPNPPNVLPTHITHAIEERMLQVVGLIARPSVANVRHMPRLQPLLLARRRHKLKGPIRPALVIPNQPFIGRRRPFRLKHDRVPALVRSRSIRPWQSAEGISVHAVYPNLGHQLRRGLPVRHPRIARPVVPSHRGK